MVSKIKQYINLGKREIEEITTAIERSASIVPKDSCSFGTYDLIEVNKNITFKHILSEKIKQIAPNELEDGISLLFALVSMKNNMKDQIDHIFSLEIDKDKVIGFYVNTRYLEEQLSINKLYINQLRECKDLYESLNILIEIFLSKSDKYTQQKIAKIDISECNIYNKIEVIKDLLIYLYNGLDLYDVLSNYYLFKTTDIKIKKSIDIDNKITLGLYNFYKNKIYKIESPKCGTSVVNFNEDLKSDSQKNAMNDITAKYTNIIGQAGSGKTHLASLIARRYIELAALSNSTINTLYTTYSKYSLEQFKIYTNQYDGLIFEDTKECIENKINQLESSIDMDKFIRIENMIKEFDISKIENRYSKDVERINQLNKGYSYSLDENQNNNIKRLCKYLEDHYVKPNLFTSLFLKLGFIKENKFNLNNNLTKPLQNIGGLKIPTSIDEYGLLDLSNELKEFQIKRNKQVNAFFKNNDFEIIKDEPTKFYGLNISIEDLVYYLVNKPLVKNKNRKDKYIVELQKVLNKEKYDAEILKELFPIFTGLVTEIKDFNILFNQILVDESVLVPGYFFPLIMNKGEYIIALGDVNQLSLQQSFFPNIELLVKKIYGIETRFSLSAKSTFNQESFFGHMLNITPKENTLVLTDNYRNNKEIFKLSKEIGGDEYNTYFEKYINKHNLNCEVNDLTKHYIVDDNTLTFNNEDIQTPFVFIDNNEDKFNKVFNLLKENKLTKDDLMIVVPFKKDIQMLQINLGNGILIDTIENIQGIEKKIVVFYWDPQTVSSDSFKYLDKTRFNLMITRAKNLFITIGNKDFLLESNIDKDSYKNGFIVVNKFLRNPKFYIQNI